MGLSSRLTTALNRPDQHACKSKPNQKQDEIRSATATVKPTQKHQT